MSRRLASGWLAVAVLATACATASDGDSNTAPLPPSLEEDVGPMSELGPRPNQPVLHEPAERQAVQAPPPATVPAPAQPVAVETSKTAQHLAFPVETFRDSQPPAGKPRPFQLPGIARFKLPKLGIEVFLVERHALPTVSMTLTFAGGSANDPRGKESMAKVCMDLMEQGTQRLDKIAFEEAQADTASTVSAWAATDQMGVTLYALSRHLDATLDLWTEMLFEPGLRQTDLDRLVQRRKESLKQTKGSVASVARRLSGYVAYGARHALGRMETEKSFDAITVADCKKHHKTWLKPRGAQLFVVGDIDEAGIRARVEKRLLDRRWKGRPRKAAKLGRPQPTRGRIFFSAIDGAEQSAIYLMHLGPRRNAKDYIATKLMTGVLGGSFSSRLNMNLREDKGWTYGARGGFSYNREGSTFIASSSVRTEHTRDAIEEVFREIAQLQSGKVPAREEELKREKDGSILALPATFATSRAVLDRYRSLIRYGLPLDYYNSYVPAIAAATPAQVAGAAKKRLKPADLQILVVGDTEKVLPGLKALVAQKKFGKGALVVLDADGKQLERVTAKQAAQNAAKAAPAK